MSFVFQPWQSLFMILAGWVNQQQQINDFYRIEIEALLEKLGKKRIVLNALASGLSPRAA